ncbi:hypothetical protein MSG28_002275 [Choristoneura fumiferana]|uniref:Uncharacterized protein n=1 Tax=Choristoneura fumiferana TaxID=7141 RepID=A0ACC0JVA3_CHOFU|nr:hypothetical protein MSG28_002275 [Choristoneura fumiferana]
MLVRMQGSGSDVESVSRPARALSLDPGLSRSRQTALAQVMEMETPGPWTKQVSPDSPWGEYEWILKFTMHQKRRQYCSRVAAGVEMTSRSVQPYLYEKPAPSQRTFNSANYQQSSISITWMVLVLIDALLFINNVVSKLANNGTPSSKPREVGHARNVVRGGEMLVGGAAHAATPSPFTVARPRRPAPSPHPLTPRQPPTLRATFNPK